MSIQEAQREIFSPMEVYDEKDPLSRGYIPESNTHARRVGKQAHGLALFPVSKN